MNSVETVSEDQASSVGPRSVERALNILVSVALAEDGETLSEVARAVGLPVSTTGRLLSSLSTSGFVSREAHGRYKAGPKLHHIGAIALGRLAIYDLVELHLQSLSEYTGETAYFAVADGNHRAVYLRQVESPLAIRHTSWAGRSIDTAGTAIGAALSDSLPEAGYALSRATAVEPDAAAVAAPIRDERGGVIGALSIIGPSFRMSDEELNRFGVEVKRHADEVALSLRMLPSS